MTQFHRGCPACDHDAEALGPVVGCDPPPRPNAWRWSMTPEEWAGEPPMREPE